jgi:hypothetical protein
MEIQLVHLSHEGKMIAISQEEREFLKGFGGNKGV